jgi:hypothetical protein
LSVPCGSSFNPPRDNIDSDAYLLEHLGGLRH